MNPLKIAAIKGPRPIPLTDFSPMIATVFLLRRAIRAAAAMEGGSHMHKCGSPRGVPPAEYEAQYYAQAAVA